MKTALLAFAFLSFACASLFQGTKQTLDMDSGPQAAQVWVNGAQLGVTPCKIELKRNQEYTIEFRKEGYETRSYRILNGIGAGWVFLDVITGLIPVIIDAATGSWYSFDQANINAVLEKQK